MKFTKTLAVSFLVLMCTQSSVFGFNPYGFLSIDAEFGQTDDSYEVILPNFLGAPLQGSVSHTEGRWLDNTQGYTSFGIFSAIPQGPKTNLLPFIDVKFHVFNSNHTAANIGGGIRYLTAANFVVGLNAFYDYREVYKHHTCHQMGIGGEILGPLFDFRCNGYIPLDVSAFVTSKHTYHFDPYVAVCRGKRHQALGCDMEFGKWLKQMTSNSNYDLYAGIGAYYFHTKDPSRNILGLEARLSSDIGRYISIEVKGGYDPVYGGSLQANLDLTLSFASFTSFWNTLFDEFSMGYMAYQPVRRQEIIIAGPRECCWSWNWD